jgi:hypothetical protein
MLMFLLRITVLQLDSCLYTLISFIYVMVKSKGGLTVLLKKEPLICMHH